MASGTVVLNLELKIAKLERKLATAEKRLARTETRFAKMGSQIKNHLAGMFAVTAIIEFGRAQLDLVKKIDQSNRALKAITGTSLEYERAKTMLAVSAEEFGVNILDLTKSYVRFYAASKSSTLATRELDEIFNKMTKSASVLGLSASDTEGVLKALEQILSKNKVQAEELRGQLGDRLPGAFVIMAKSMGVTTAQLDKMLKTGGVMADEVLPNFAKEYEKAVGADQVKKVDTLVSAFERAKNSWISWLESVEDGDGIIANSLKSSLSMFSNFFTVLEGMNMGLIDPAVVIQAFQSPGHIITVFPKLAEQVNDAKQRIAQDVNATSENLNAFQKELAKIYANTDLSEMQLTEIFIGKGMTLQEADKLVSFIKAARGELDNIDNEKLKERFDLFKKETEELERQLFYNKRLEDGLSKIKTDFNSFEDRMSLMREVLGLGTSFEDQNKPVDSLFDAVDPFPEEEAKEFVEKKKQQMDEIAQILESTIEGMFVGIGQAIGTGGNIFDAMKKVLGRGMQEIGAAMIAYGISLEKFKLAIKSWALSNPALAVAAGTALVAAGAALSSSANKLGGSRGGGGGAYGGRGGGFRGTQTGQTLEFEPIKLTLTGNQLEGYLRQRNTRRTI